MRIRASDDWMVRVTRSEATGPASGRFERYTALTGIDPMPGVHFWTAETGPLALVSDAWRATRERIEAVDGDEGETRANAVYDAAYAFLALGLPPMRVPSAWQRPDALTVEIGDDAWTFDAASAPAAAWAVLAAAR